MRIEAVSVCVDYGDFLAVTAKHNRGLLDRWIIATEERDTETRRVCRKYDLECVLCDGIRQPNAFRKAEAINRALAMTSLDSWHLHIDADIALPCDMRHCLNRARLDDRCIYGADRITVSGYGQWKQFAQRWQGCHTEGYRVQFDRNIGVRVSLPCDGYAPIGYFQLWHASQEEFEAVRYRRYPERHHSAARCDVQFALQWERSRRVLLPEMYVVHLESEAGGMGANWRGRTTRRYGPGLLVDSKTRYA
jgi:hypothetical protein